MAFGAIFGAIGRWWRGLKRPFRPPGGHRGLALRDRRHPDISAANQAKWEILTSDDEKDFLDGYPFFVHSSNVLMVQFHIAVEQMMIEYKNGRAYLYKQITMDDAQILFKAFSKGGWVWDNLRIRGTVKGFKKPYIRLK